MLSGRLLTVGPSGKPLWVRLYLRPLGEEWAAMILGDTVPPPPPGQVEGVVFLAATAAEAKRLAVAYLGDSVAQNEGSATP